MTGDGPDQAALAPSPSALGNVGRLLRKDLRQHRWLLPLVLAFELISLEILRAQTGPRAVPILLQLLGWIAAFIFCFRTAVAEEKARAFRFLMALPLTASELVSAKYVFNVVLVVINFGLVLLYLLASGKLLGRPSGLTSSIALLGLLLATQLLASCIVLAVALLFDSEKAIWVVFPLIWVAASASARLPRLARFLGLDWQSFWPRALPWSSAVSLALAALLAIGVPLIARHRRWSL